jgi:hypothetical protein
MKAEINKLSVLNFARGVTVWIYKMEDRPFKHALLPGFFDGVADTVSVGDQITLTGHQGGAFLFVTKCDHTGVTVAPPVVLGGV